MKEYLRCLTEIFFDIPRRPDQLIFNSTKGEYQNTVDYYSTIRTIFLTLREMLLINIVFFNEDGVIFKALESL
jgi:hypothetical protein